MNDDQEEDNYVIEYITSNHFTCFRMPGDCRSLSEAISAADALFLDKDVVEVSIYEIRKEMLWSKHKTEGVFQSFKFLENR